MAADSEFLTVAEVAELVKLSDQTLYNRVADGSLPHVKVGGRTLIRREDVDAMSGGSGSTGDLLTVAEVAGVTVRNWIDRGTLPAIHVGRRVRIRRQDFDALVANGAAGSRPPTPKKRPAAADFWGGEPVGEAMLPQDGSGSPGGP